MMADQDLYAGLIRLHVLYHASVGMVFGLGVIRELQHHGYRVVRKHAGKQPTGWRFTMRQLYEKSGSAARFSDFAVDLRKAVEASHLPEYELTVNRNQEGEEVVQFIHKSHLAIDHPHWQHERFPGRRQTRGIFSESFTFNALAAPADDEDSGD
jgi:hypothetical protein